MRIVSSNALWPPAVRSALKSSRNFSRSSRKQEDASRLKGTGGQKIQEIMVLSTCSSLIAIVNVEGSPVIQFSHFSVKEYLTSTRIVEGHVLRYYIPLEPAHLFVTQACLTVLLQIMTEESIEELPLARYAGQYWADHAEFGDVSSHTEDWIKRLFNPENHHFANWTRIYDTISEVSNPSHRKWAPLHYAARHGFPGVIEWLITTCSRDVNARGPDSATPLYIAVINRQFTAAQALLKHGANVDAGNGMGHTPLHHVSRLGDYKVSRLLLEHGANTNSKTIGDETPLRLLAEGSGNLEVAQLLLEHGADPSIRSGTGRDSLYMALLNGQPGLAQLLLKHGADPNGVDVYGRTLLHVASERGT